MIAASDEGTRSSPIASHLGDREGEQPAPPGQNAAQRPGAPGQREQHERAERDASPREVRRGDAVVNRDLDEQVRHAPDE
jgi:hypothetical protein